MKTFFSLCVLWLFVALTSCSSPASTQPAGCLSDNDCKGDRICAAGSCVSPPSNGEGEPPADQKPEKQRTPKDEEAAPPKKEAKAPTQGSACEELAANYHSWCKSVNDPQSDYICEDTARHLSILKTESDCRTRATEIKDAANGYEGKHCERLFKQVKRWCNSENIERQLVCAEQERKIDAMRGVSRDKGCKEISDAILASGQN